MNLLLQTGDPFLNELLSCSLHFTFRVIRVFRGLKFSSNSLPIAFSSGFRLRGRFGGIDEQLRISH